PLCFGLHGRRDPQERNAGARYGFHRETLLVRVAVAPRLRGAGRAGAQEDRRLRRRTGEGTWRRWEVTEGGWSADTPVVLVAEGDDAEFDKTCLAMTQAHIQNAVRRVRSGEQLLS